MHIAALLLGFWLLLRGAQPVWVTRLTPFNRTRVESSQPIAWAGAQRSARSAAAGLAWVAWPCGLLQSALVVAALGNGAWSGAGAMAAFALASSPGLMAGPWLLRLAGQHAGAIGVDAQRLLARLSGLMLVLASLWAVGHGLWEPLLAWCFS